MYQGDKVINKRERGIMKSTSTIRENVEKLLVKYPHLRNDDKELMVKYWEEVDQLDFTSVIRFLNGFKSASTASPESIRRARALIQSEGKLLPTDETVKARRWKRTAMEEALKNGQVV